MSEQQKPARKYGPANLVYDIEAADSLISPNQFKERQDRLAKFQRRAAHPNVRREYHNAERLRIIDRMLALTVRPIYVDLIAAALRLEWYKDKKRLEQALTILKGNAEDDRDEQPTLTARSDPFRQYWKADANCYAFQSKQTLESLNITSGASLRARKVQPERGDVVVCTSDGGSSIYLARYVVGDRQRVLVDMADGCRKILPNATVLVVYSIHNGGGA